MTMNGYKDWSSRSGGKPLTFHGSYVIKMNDVHSVLGETDRAAYLSINSEF